MYVLEAVEAGREGQQQDDWEEEAGLEAQRALLEPELAGAGAVRGAQEVREVLVQTAWRAMADWGVVEERQARRTRRMSHVWGWMEVSPRQVVYLWFRMSMSTQR